MTYVGDNDDKSRNLEFTPGFGSRLSSIVNQIGSLEKAGEIAGVTGEQVGRWMRGRARPSFFGIVALANAARVRLDWLATGDGDRQPSPWPRSIIELMPEVMDKERRIRIAGDEDLGPEWVLLPRHAVRAGAGNGVAVVSERIVDHLAFRAEWLRGVLRRGPAGLILVEARGDSMEPTIHDRDLLLVDTAENQVRHNAIYVLSIDGDLLVKRIQRRLTGGPLAISDNPRYPAEELTVPDDDRVRVVGEVVWRAGPL